MKELNNLTKVIEETRQDLDTVWTMAKSIKSTFEGKKREQISSWLALLFLLSSRWTFSTTVIWKTPIHSPKHCNHTGYKCIQLQVAQFRKHWASLKLHTAICFCRESPDRCAARIPAQAWQRRGQVLAAPSRCRAGARVPPLPDSSIPPCSSPCMSPALGDTGQPSKQWGAAPPTPCKHHFQPSCSFQHTRNYSHIQWDLLNSGVNVHFDQHKLGRKMSVDTRNIYFPFSIISYLWLFQSCQFAWYFGRALLPSLLITMFHFLQFYFAWLKN